MESSPVLSIECAGEQYYIDAESYNGAIGGAIDDAIDDAIAAEIDGKLYPAATQLIINLMRGEQPRMAWMHADIPEYLAIIKWCDDVLSSSAAYNEWKQQVRIVICGCINIIRAITCSDDELVGGTSERFRLLDRSGLNFVIPDYIKTMILVPVAAGTDFASAVVIDDTALLKFQQQIRNDFIHREMLIVSSCEPLYMKTHNFGEECRDVMRMLFNEEELALGYSNPYLSICDVFEYGLELALEQ